MIRHLRLGLLRSLFLVAAAFSLALPNAANADVRRTAEEAHALVLAAVQHYRDVGQEQAFADFMDVDGRFYEEDLYVVVIDVEVPAVAVQPFFPPLIGDPEAMLIQNLDGEYPLQIVMDGAIANPDGSWVQFGWTNPSSNAHEEWRGFTFLVDRFAFCSGYFLEP